MIWRTVSETLLIGIVLGLALFGWLSRRRNPARSATQTLQRLHPGVADKAEWMASETVVQHVTTDYLAAQRWLAETQLLDYMTCLRGIERYFSGAMLREHQRLLQHQLSRNRARFVGILRADHTISVRRFGEDGQSCLIIDRQSERRMATYDYWTKQRILTQDLGAGDLVYQMIYDRGVGRWKVDDFIQQLPIGWETLPGSTFRMGDALPLAAGRDI